MARDYAVRRRGPDDWYYPFRVNRWLIHVDGYPLMVVGSAFTKRAALRQARRWTREEERAARSYKA